MADGIGGGTAGGIGGGLHLIAGEWVAGAGTFQSSPWTGEGRAFAVGSPELVDRAARAAEAAFPAYAATSREERARFLEAIAEEIDARAATITEVGSAESGLPAARLEGERGRTTGQLRLFASHIRAGDYLDRRHDAALPDRKPLPRPDLKLMQLPIGPVAVFGASNFPLAFSVAGATPPRRSPPAARWWSRATPPTPARARRWPTPSSPPSAPPGCPRACSP